MKAGLTKSAIDAFAAALEAEGAIDAAARLKAISPIFKGFASRRLEDLLALLDRVLPEQVQSDEASSGARVGAVVASLRNLELIVSKTSTQSRLHDLIQFRARLQRHESLIIERLVTVVQVLRRGGGDEGPVDPNGNYKRLAEQLKAALGHDDQFSPLFEQLSALDAEGVASVANALMSSGTSKSRKRDLLRIQQRHESQRALLAKQRAMAGRSAA